MTSHDDDAVAVTGSHLEPHVAALFGGLSAADVYHTERLDDTLVITASAIERAGGFGFGAGQGSDAASGDSGGGGGGGGGGTAQGRPVAVIRVGADGSIAVSPVFDYTKIAITVIAAVLATWRAMRR